MFSPFAFVALVAVLALLVIFHTIRPAWATSWRASWPSWRMSSLGFARGGFVRRPRRAGLGLGVALVACALAACGTTGGGGVPVPNTPTQVVFTAEGVLTGLIQGAATYAELPSCTTGGPTICSVPALVGDMKTAANAASAAVLAAQAAVAADPAAKSAATQAAIAAAVAAVADLQGLAATNPATQ